LGDAIAGERERHTLETLLASRISDRAILLGKVIVTTGYAWGTALLGLLFGLFVATLVLVVGGVVVIKVLPAQAISSLSTSQIWLIVMAVLAVLDAILLGVSLVSFRRSRLMLS
jgi:ABC-2 type transport system permease protein